MSSDHRGFLERERHPEIGITEAAATFQPIEIVDPDGFVEIEAADAGNDWTYYTRDARGNVLTKRLEGSTDFDLNYSYDGAGRLIRVEEDRGGTPRLLKDFFYGYESSGVDMRKGKLVQARRHNWIRKIQPLGALAIDPDDKDEDAVITEVFQYEGRDGRVSARQTRYHFRGETYAFNLSQTYDDLGNVNALTYPRCVQAADGCRDAAPSRTVTYQYTKGFLTGVPGYATSIAYQAGGMLHEIEHANGVVYTMELNPSDGIERPYRISTSAGWDTGTYAYDGVGNIHRIGTENFRYDRMSRLVSGQVKVGTNLRTQTVTYDDFGNITSLVTNGSLQSTPTDPTTNRLQSPLAEYDGGGNVTVLDYGSERYEYAYDGSNMMKYLTSDTGLARTFLYTADDERVVGHERDSNDNRSKGALDYMHARFCSPTVARFLVTDPKTLRNSTKRAQRWNRYMYALGNPLTFVDPNGRDVVIENEKDRNFYERAARRNSRVRAVFDAFAPGTGRDLVIRRGNPGEHPGTGAKRRAVTNAFYREATPEELRASDAAAGGGQATERLHRRSYVPQMLLQGVDKPGERRRKPCWPRGSSCVMPR